MSSAILTWAIRFGEMREIKPSYIGEFQKFIKDWKHKLGYILLLIGAIIVGIYISWQVNSYFLPFWILDQYLAQYFWAGLILFIMGWVMYFLYRRGDKNVRLIDYSRVGLDLRALKKSIPYLILTLGIPLLTYNILAYVLDLPLWWPRPIS